MLFTLLVGAFLVLTAPTRFDKNGVTVLLPVWFLILDLTAAYTFDESFILQLQHVGGYYLEHFSRYFF